MTIRAATPSIYMQFVPSRLVADRKREKLFLSRSTAKSQDINSIRNRFSLILGIVLITEINYKAVGIQFIEQHKGVLLLMYTVTYS